MAKKKKNQNKNTQSECFVKFALKNVVLNEFLLILFHYLMSINYVNIYWRKLLMTSPIIHNSSV